jgi:hypothetical protein
MDDSAFVARRRVLREMIRAATPDMTVDTGLTDTWFDCCSERINWIRSFQRDLVEPMRVRCQGLIAQAERERHEPEGLLRSLRATWSMGASETLISCFPIRTTDGPAFSRVAPLGTRADRMPRRHLISLSQDQFVKTRPHPIDQDAPLAQQMVTRHSFLRVARLHLGSY